MRLAPALTFALSVSLCTHAAAQAARTQAGKIEFVSGRVTVLDADSKGRAPKNGERLFEGDSVVTGADGELHAELADGGVIAVRPNTAMSISSYRADGGAQDTSVFGLVKGSFRSITGWIGKNNPANYKILTPTATAGVRGTDHEPLVIPEGSTEGEPGTYDRVHKGASYLEGKTGRVDIAQGRVGHFAAHGRDRPRVLDSLPPFFRATRNEKRIEGRHERVLARVEQRRAERQKAVAAERARSEGRSRAQEQQRQREQQKAQREQQGKQHQADRQKVRQERARHAQQQRQQAQQHRQQARQQTQSQQRQTSPQKAQSQERRTKPKAREEHAVAPHSGSARTHR